MTDVPSMALTKKNGGHTIAVYSDTGRHGKEVCVDLLRAKRVDFIAPADYQEGSELSRRTQLLLDAVISDIAFRNEAALCLQENGLRDND